MSYLRDNFEIVRNLTEFVFGDGLKKSDLNPSTMEQIDAHTNNLAPQESKQIIKGLMLHIKQLKRAVARNLHDPLTGAYTRQAFVSDLITKLLSGQIPTDDSVHLVLMDLDGFKKLNDNCGHLAGDEALQEFVKRLSEHLGADTVIGRLGGDEFAIIVHGKFDEANLKSQVREAVRGIYEMSDPEISNNSNEIYPLGVSLGVVSLGEAEGIHTQNYKSVIHNLMQSADREVYSDKRTKLERLDELQNEISGTIKGSQPGFQPALPIHE